MEGEVFYFVPLIHAWIIEFPYDWNEEKWTSLVGTLAKKKTLTEGP